jgi:hypothetical protein
MHKVDPVFGIGMNFHAGIAENAVDAIKGAAWRLEFVPRLAEFCQYIGHAFVHIYVDAVVNEHEAVGVGRPGGGSGGFGNVPGRRLG